MDDPEIKTQQTLLQSIQTALEALRASSLTPEQSAHVEQIGRALKQLAPSLTAAAISPAATSRAASPSATSPSAASHAAIFAASPDALTAATDPPKPGLTLKVLVVDDRDRERVTLVGKLTELGCTCDGVQAGFRATGRLMRAMAESPYQAVLIHSGLRDTLSTDLARAITQDPRWQNPRVALLGTPTPAPPPPNVHVFQGPPTADALSLWLSPLAHQAPADTTPPPIVLVAEDSRVNQKLAEAMLTRLGYRPLIVDNGKKAVEQHKTPGVVAILMDGQMPEMDGYQATQAIRALESQHQTQNQTTPTTRLPIIGLSADDHARPAALAVGMDDYLLKPVTFDDLRDALERLLGPAKGSQSSGPRTTSPFENATEADLGLDLAALRQLRLVSGDDALLRDVCQQFLTDLPSRRQAIQDAVKRDAWDEVAKIAHALKSAACSVGARALGVACGKAERCSAARPAPRGWLADLNAACTQAEHAIQGLLKRLGS